MAVEMVAAGPMTAAATATTWRSSQPLGRGPFGGLPPSAVDLVGCPLASRRPLFREETLMGVLDDHNRQHTYGNSLGPPTSVVGIAAQQSIDAHNRLVEASVSAPATGSIPPGPRPHFVFAMISGAVFLCAAIAAYVVGGVGAVALGLVAFGAGVFTCIFLVAALIELLKSGFSSLKRSSRPVQRD